MYKKISMFFVIILILTVTGIAFFNNDSNIFAHNIFFNNQNDSKAFDVIVIGGEPEGVAAALSAARNGAKTLLIEKRASLGGLFTYGKMNVLDFPHGIGRKIQSHGIFQEWHLMVGGQKSFEINAAKNAFFKMVKTQKNLSMLLNTKIKEVVLNDRQEIESLKILEKDKVYTLHAKYFIDATQDADIAYLSGVPSFIGAEDVGHKNRLMAATLMIHLIGVDWDKIKETAKKETFGPAQVKRGAAWGFSKLRELYKPNDPNMRLRGLNLIRNDEGYFINALQIFGVDGLSDASIQEGITRGKKETVYILDWLKNNFPGFENAEIASFPEELYIRESRHIYSLYQLPVSDLWENKYHWDTIAYGGYPADIQATAVDDPGAIVLNPTQYGIPFRSLVPQKITNLLVIGRSSGYSSLAQGSVRIIPTGMATGEGAGAASAVAFNKNIDFHTMASKNDAIAELQQALKAQGAAVEKFTLPFPYEDKWYYPAIRELLNHRALFGGYKNDLSEYKIAQNKLFSTLLLQTYQAKQPNNPNYEENILYLKKYYKANEIRNLTVEEINAIIAGLPYKDFDDTYQKELERMSSEKALTREDMYIIIGKLFGWI